MRYAASGKRSAVGSVSSMSSVGLGIGHDYYWKVCVLIVLVSPVWDGQV